MTFKTFKELFQNDFSPAIQVMSINWITIHNEKKENPVKESEKTVEKSEAAKEYENDIDINITDITPKGFFRRK